MTLYASVLLLVTGLMLVSAALASGARAADHIDPIGIRDFCSDEDNSGAPYSDPNGGPPIETPSVIPFAGSWHDMPPRIGADGREMTVREARYSLFVEDPNGELLEYYGRVLDDLKFQGLIGIDQGGTYQITKLTVTAETDSGTVSESIKGKKFPNKGRMDVTFDESKPCDATTVKPGTFAPAEEPRAEVEEEAAETATPEAQPAAAPASSADEDGGVPSWALIGGGLLLAGAGAALIVRKQSTPATAGGTQATDDAGTAASMDSPEVRGEFTRARVITPEMRELQQAVYQAGEDVGMQLVGRSDWREFTEAWAGEQRDPLDERGELLPVDTTPDTSGTKIGMKGEMIVAVGADGQLVNQARHRREGDAPSTHLLKIWVAPTVVFGVDRNVPIIRWIANVSVIELTKNEHVLGESSADEAGEEALAGDRPIHVYGNDPIYQAALPGFLHETPREAVRAALEKISSDGRINLPAPRPGVRWRGMPDPSAPTR
jgi:hypothetical protein